MSKINPNIKATKEIFDDERLAGGYGPLAAKEDNVSALKRVVMANLLWEDLAYIDGKKASSEIERLIPLCSAKDVYNIALAARLEQKLRHTPLFIASEMCKYDEHKAYVKELLPKIITRVDMITDFMAIYWRDGKKPICAVAKKGLAAAFHNFDEYQFAKYDRDAAIKLRDVMFLCHPKANDKAEEELFKKIAERNLSTPDTWEVALSKGDDKKETWTRLIDTKKIGGLAFLRNIRNMMDAEVDGAEIRKGLSNLSSTMLLPLDFYKALLNAPSFSKEIEEAMLNSYKNLPKLPGRTLFIVDCSGSMDSRISSRSNFRRIDCAKAMAMLAANQCEDFELVCTAGDDGERIHSSKEIKYPSKGFNIFSQINSDRIGYGGIFTRQCLEWCRENYKGDFDRIIVFSDSQDCDYAGRRTPNPFGKHNYICDVSAEKKGVNYEGCWDAEISGFSEHFINYIASMEGLENRFED